MPPHRFHIMLALADRDRHGLGIMKDVLDRTDGHVRLWPGMLYRTLQELRREGLIADTPAPDAAEPGQPRYYRLTAEGRRATKAEAARLAGVVQVARARRLLPGRAEDQTR